MRFAALTVTATAATALLTGCMGDDVERYDAAAYRPGDCRSASAPVFEIDQSVRTVVSDGRSPGDAAGALKKSQQRLIAAMPELTDASLRADAQRVVDAVGFYRIGVDSKNFTPKLALAVQTASTRLLTSCTA